jgi:TRAP transporter 4TM/12TM fusion protein
MSNLKQNANAETVPNPSENEGLAHDALQDLVVESDTGARSPRGIAAYLMFFTALFWSLFQLWQGSKLPFIVTEFFPSLSAIILNDTQTRYIHLALAMFLAFLAYPALKTSPRKRIPLSDWIFAGMATYSTLYLLIFYEELSARSGMPTNVFQAMVEGRFEYEGLWTTVQRIIFDDVFVAIVGIVLLLEATRRALGPPLMVIAIVFLLYTFFGSSEFVPEMIRWKGASFEKIASHQWLTSEGVFGVALGVSTSFVFLFVLFGSLLDKAGAGNYFIKVAFSLLGHMRGGPAKAAVVSSALTGLVSGSSIANVVTTGTFTIPLMRRVGFSKEQAGAVEVSSSVNGQIMPPVMGAAAFLMVEYVGISYTEVVKHAFIPAVISYIALAYIVHLEALKANMKVLPKNVKKTFLQSALTFGIVASGIIALSGCVYYGVGWIKDLFPETASEILAVVIFAVYIALIKFEARYPELEVDDPTKPLERLPDAAPTVKAGLHYLLPIVVLVWCLMVERLSPGLSAFWATSLIAFILVTQRPIKAFFRKTANYGAAFKAGWFELVDGMVTGARNMVGIGVATAAAGIVVGAVSLTGVGQVMTEVVEVLSGGSILMVLLLTALISLILGMGLPTTANYIVVASLMAPIIQDLGAQNGMIIPAIAVHLFVFYFGIMADITPPVGLASFAAAAISGGDPIRTGLVSFFYSMRTVILPFLFIYNTNILLVGIDSFIPGLLIFIKATIAMLLFAAATQGYFLVRSKWYESAILLLVTFMLFTPRFFMNYIIPPFDELKPTQWEAAMNHAEKGELVRLHIDGKNSVGQDREIIATIVVKDPQKEPLQQLQDFGLILHHDGEKLVVDDVVFDSDAQKAGIDIDRAFDMGFEYVVTSVGVPSNQPSKHWMYVPALFLLGLVVWLQRNRKSGKEIRFQALKMTA